MTTAREETARLADLLGREQHALAEFIAALAKFDAERRWVELGHSSLFSFLVRELRLSKGAAFYRKTAAELIQRFPEVLAALREGKLCMTSVVELAKVVTPENLAEVLPRFFHLSKAEAKEVTAALLPVAAPPLRTVVTAVRAEAPAPALGLVAPLSAAGMAFAIPQNETDQVGWPANLGHANGSVPGVASAAPLATEPPSAAPSAQPVHALQVPAPASRRRADVEPMTAELARIHLTVPKRLLQKLAEARDALSHSNPGASDDEILELGLDLIVSRHRKRRGIGAKPRKSTCEIDPAVVPAAAAAAAAAAVPAPATDTATAPAPSPAAVPAVGPAGPASPPPPPTRTRHVPAHVWRAVWERDGGRCVWPLDGGGVCGSTRRLQLDHVGGFALGAGTTIEECRLLCAFHQDVSARELYGDGVMDRYTASKHGGRCSEPVASYVALRGGAHLEVTSRSTWPVEGIRRDAARGRSRATCSCVRPQPPPRAPAAAVAATRLGARNASPRVRGGDRGHWLLSPGKTFRAEGT